MIPLSAVCVAVQDSQGRLLAISRRHDPSRWGLPGGKVDPGETNIEAAVRECREELGFEFDPQLLEPLFCALCPGKGPKDTYWVTTYLYRGAAPSLVELQAEEGLYLQWLQAQQLSDPAVSPFAHYNQGVSAAMSTYLKSLS